MDERNIGESRFSLAVGTYPWLPFPRETKVPGEEV